jgi:hypothetical protein
MQDGCLVNDPSGGRLEERDCEKSGVCTLHESRWIPPDPGVPDARSWWEVVCLGQARADFEAGR